MLKFKNIEELKLIRVGENTYSVSIKSAYLNDEEKLEDVTFKATACRIDHDIQVQTRNSHFDQKLYDDTGMERMVKSFYIPLKIELFVDEETKTLYTITMEEKQDD